MNKKIVACLENEGNDYQQMWRDDALAAARRAGVEMDIHFAGGSVMRQIKQLYSYFHNGQERPTAIMVMPVRDNSLDRVARDAVSEGVGWICLHRRMDCLAELRKDSPDALVCTVKPNQVEVGQIQARQFQALLPDGGQILYVQGNAANFSAKERLDAMRDAILETNVEMAGLLDGNWTTADAERVVSGWLRVLLSSKSMINLIGCQNDLMAAGARKAAVTVSAQLRVPELAYVPITGCDGLPTFGQRLVREGQLSATVVVPSTAGPAVELVSRFIRSGYVPPAENFVNSISFPDESTLKAIKKTQMRNGAFAVGRKKLG